MENRTLPPPLLILNEKGERIGRVIEHKGLVLSYGKFYLKLEIDEEKL